MNGGFPSPRLILPLCLGLRLLLFLLIQPWAYSVRDQLVLQNDSPLYHRLACNVLDHGRFLSDGTGGPPSLNPVPVEGQLDDLRTPLYPLFVAAVYAVFGRVPWAVLVAQIILDTFTCGLLYVLLRRVFGARAAGIAALCYALDPFVILYSNTLMTESLFMFFILAATALYVFFIRDQVTRVRPLGYGLLGLVIGGAALVRPIAQYLPVLLALFVLIVERRHWKTAVFSALVIIMASGLALAPWLIRNQRTFGQAALTYIDSWDLLALNVAMMEAPKRGLDLRSTQRALLDEAEAMMVADGRDPLTLSNLQKAAYWRDLGVRYVLRDPLRFAWYHVKGMAAVVGGLGTSDFARMLRVAQAAGKTAFQLATGGVIALFLLLTYSAAVTGIITAWREHDWRVLLLCILMASYFLAATGALGVVRLKLPAVPFYLAFTGLGADWWLRRRDQRRRAPTLTAAMTE